MVTVYKPSTLRSAKAVLIAVIPAPLSGMLSQATAELQVCHLRGKGDIGGVYQSTHESTAAVVLREIAVECPLCWRQPPDGEHLARRQQFEIMIKTYLTLPAPTEFAGA
ncbi:MAG: hypothetical protein Q8R44_04295 [Novosphingobium sp.]|nr:hypothetical protein [Novosphingobium sp.]